MSKPMTCTMPPKRYGKGIELVDSQPGHENDIPRDLDEEDTFGR